MNFWTPTFHSWGDGFNPVDMPWYVLYDYVEVFNYDQATGEFVFDWRDDFDAFDSGRWHKASGGFEANSSIFYPSNVYTSGGNLVLKMEPMDHHDDHHTYHHADVTDHGIHSVHGHDYGHASHGHEFSHPSHGVGYGPEYHHDSPHHS